MSMIEDFLKRVDVLADQTGQSVSTLSRKLFNDGKGIARLREGGQMTIKTLDAALEKLLGLEQDADPEHALRCLLYTSPSPRDQRGSRMPSSA